MRHLVSRSPFQNMQQLLQLVLHLLDNLLAMGNVTLRVISGQALTRATDSEAVFIEQAADLAHDDHILPLIITPVTAPFERLELGELLLPVAQHMRLDIAQVTYLTDSEVALAGNDRQSVMAAGFQHTPLPALLISGQDERLRHGAM